MLYNFFIILFYLAIGLAAFFNKKAKQWIKGRKQFPKLDLKHKSIWMHCASLGEFEQGRTVIESLKKEYPHYPVVLSFFSPSGYENRKNYSGADHIIYLPLDTPKNAQKLIDEINPEIVLWVKYEYWFNYLNELKKRKIPVLLVSGIFRPSQPFFKWYGKKWKYILNSFEHLFIQNESSSELLSSIGLKNKFIISGDSRFDRVIEIAEKKETVEGIAEFINNKKVLVAGSTWEEDEELLVHYSKIEKNIKFIIVPHEIGSKHLKDLKKQFQDSIFYSEINQVINSNEYQTLIVDCIGLLSKLYQYATVTYVGGGFNSSGIHNSLEAAVFGKPIVFGPIYEKFAEARDLVDEGAASSVDNAIELEKIFDSLFKNESSLTLSGTRAMKYVYAKRGATQKIMDYVEEKRLLTR